MAWDTILFDLDGTLMDPKEGITRSVAHALAHFGIRAELEDLTRFIGPPLSESFPESYGFDDAQTAVATEKFREYFSRQGWRENVPYPGIAEVLEELRAAGKRLVVATSKPEPFAVRVLEHFGMAGHFTCICGAPMADEELAKKPAIVAGALRRAGVADESSAVMVGDRRYDVAGAHANRLAAVGVLYGYGSRAELEAAGAEHIAADLGELRQILLSSGGAPAGGSRRS